MDNGPREHHSVLCMRGVMAPTGKCEYGPCNPNILLAGKESSSKTEIKGMHAACANDDAAVAMQQESQAVFQWYKETRLVGEDTSAMPESCLEPQVRGSSSACLLRVLLPLLYP